MNELVKRIWILPAATILLPLALLLTVNTPGVGFGVSRLARDIYEVMFWAAPLSGIATLLFVSACRVFDLGDARHPLARRAVRLAGLAAFSPVWLLGLQILLSGFAR